MNKICVLGLGYIGLPTACMFANNGFEVRAVDINKNTVNIINHGGVHIEEPGLNTLVQRAINSGRLQIRTVPDKADVFIIAVQTPLNIKKHADLSFVINAIESIIPFLTKGNLIIIESTVPPGTSINLLVPILKKAHLKIGSELFIAHCPERVLPGSIITEIINNDRVIGGINLASAKKAKMLYKSFVKGEIFLTNATSAELIKLVENTFRDVNIALANELAQICYELNVNVWEVIHLANKHPRVNIHMPGPGVGGHCIAIDPYFIIEKLETKNGLISKARIINTNMPNFVATVVKKYLKGLKKAKNVKIPKISIFGVSYKGNVSDTRETPALPIIRNLAKENFEINIHDPHVRHFEYKLCCLEDSVRNSHLILILSDHNEFEHLNLIQIGKLMRNKVVFDTKNCISLEKWQKAGFKIYLLGDGRQNFRYS